LPWERTTIAAIGHVNPNKRIDQLIMAISASPILRRRCRVRLIGQAAEAERERLCALAEAVEISPPEFLGWVSDEDLRLRLRDVDAISCLRNPVLEGASASLILALSSGRPTLVSGHGCYAEVPEDAVMVCAPDNEARDAMRHLERLVADPELGKAMGERARAVVKQRHTASVYADALLPFLEQIIREKPIIEARRQLRATLSEFGLAANDAARIRIEAVPSRMWL
jgi:glycosyltransferase involved in cell wall biosynthesis